MHDHHTARPVSAVGYLTPREAAAYTGLSVHYLERLRRTGEGCRYIKLGHKTVRYKREELDTWMQQHAVEGVLDV